jgi:hypothetical protein
MGAPVRPATGQDCERALAYMDTVLRNLTGAAQPGRNVALTGAAWTLGHWVAAGALEPDVVEDALSARL